MNDNVKHTPGPWESIGRFNKMMHSVHVNNSSGHIEVSTDNAIADARLIAAAPEMLEALETLSSFVFSAICQEKSYKDALAVLCDVKRQARRAIAKATGGEDE